MSVHSDLSIASMYITLNNDVAGQLVKKDEHTADPTAHWGARTF